MSDPPRPASAHLLCLDPEHPSLLLAPHLEALDLVLVPLQLALQLRLLLPLPLQRPAQLLLVVSKPLNLTLQVADATLTPKAVLDQPLSLLRTPCVHAAL